MTSTNYNEIRGKLKFVTLVFFAAFIFASCEKKLDYSRPADANTVQGDIDSAFSNLTQSPDIGWAWKFPNSVLGNKFPELLLQFFKDSTADVYSIATRGIVYDLMALRNSGTLTAAESSQALSLINAFNAFKDDDVTLRELLESPNNLTFKNRLLAFLPNYANFNALVFNVEENNVGFDVNSVVQTSLTFQKSNLFPVLKQLGIVDFDFRMMKFSRDSILLSSYKNDLENVNTTLYPFIISTAAPFIAGSTVIVSANPLKANVTAKLNGTNIPIPAGYNSVLDFFYKSYNQVYSPTYRGYGFMYNGLGSSVQPTALKDAAFITPTGSYSGNVATAPAGTVLVTLAAKFNNGTTQNLEFIKN
ncbi:MAG: hypothetical protein ICV84_12375 [Flavisolibacter sp.]|nr:hypothetical protein [Flavisolibacter sp.]